MTLANAKAATYDLLTASGPFATTEVSSCDFGAVAGFAASGIVFYPNGESTIEPLTFGGTGNIGSQSVVWRFRGDGFIKYTGNSPSFVSQVYQMIDDIQKTFGKSWRGTGTYAASFLRLTRITFNLDTIYELGGVDYGLIPFYFQEEEIDTP